MALRIGDDILQGKYRILDVIDEGAFGKVYLADDVPLIRQVAIKELRREDWTDEQYIAFRRRFQREARIGAALRHENVVEVYTLEPSGEDFYLVMECVDGPSLQKRLEGQGPLPIEEAVGIAIQLCDGLAAVHDHPLGIVHRDIKPSNILLTSQGQPKLTDFGLAQLAAESGRSLGKGGRHPGTPLYMSPEQETSSGYLRPASDVYSLGCVLFEMLTGKVYKKAGVEGTQPSLWRGDLPSWVDKVLAKMLATEWRSRFQQATEAKSELQEGLAEELRRRQQVDSRLKQAEEALAAREYAKTAQLCLQALQLTPGHPKAERILAQAEEEDRKHRERRERTRALYQQAAQLLAVGAYDKALYILKEVKALDPEYGDPQGIETAAKNCLEESRHKKKKPGTDSGPSTDRVQGLPVDTSKVATDKRRPELSCIARIAATCAAVLVLSTICSLAYNALSALLLARPDASVMPTSPPTHISPGARATFTATPVWWRLLPTPPTHTTPTVEPTSTSTLAATATPTAMTPSTATPAPVSRTPASMAPPPSFAHTVLPSPAMEPYPAPAPSKSIRGQGSVTLVWTWPGHLGPDEYFDVRICPTREGPGIPMEGYDCHTGVAWTKDTQFTYAPPDWITDVWFCWSVAVIRGQSGTMLDQLSPESELRWFRDPDR